MSKPNRYILNILGALLLSGCTSVPHNTTPYTAQIQELKAENSHVIMLDATKRVVLVSQKGTCSEPVPDAIGTIFTELARQLKAQADVQGQAKGEISGSQTAATATSIFELYQRSQGVQVLRDGLFRLCEAHLAGAVGPEEYRENLVNLITTLNYVVPMELCTKVYSQRIIQVSPNPEPAKDGEAKPTRAVIQTQTERAVPEDLISACMGKSLEFAKAAQGYSTTLLKERTIQRQLTSSPSSSSTNQSSPNP